MVVRVQNAICIYWLSLENNEETLGVSGSQSHLLASSISPPKDLVWLERAPVLRWSTCTGNLRMGDFRTVGDITAGGHTAYLFNLCEDNSRPGAREDLEIGVAEFIAAHPSFIHTNHSTLGYFLTW